MIVDPGARLMSKHLRRAPPHHWMAAVCDMNFDQDVNRELLLWIIRHKSCESSVALAAYWHLGPRWDAQYWDRDSIESPEELTTFDLLREIEHRFKHSFYKQGKLGFTPQNDSFASEPERPGYDWTSDYNDRPIARPIPSIMLSAVPGKKIYRSDPELQTWIEGLPEYVWNAADRLSGSQLKLALTVIPALLWNTVTRQSPSLKTL